MVSQIGLYHRFLSFLATFSSITEDVRVKPKVRFRFRGGGCEVLLVLGGGVSLASAQPISSSSSSASVWSDVPKEDTSQESVYR